MKLFVHYLVILTGILNIVYSNKCAIRDYGKNRLACVCNKTYCDTIDPVKKVGEGTFLKYTSNEDGLRFKKEIGNFTNAANSPNIISINSDKVFQEINGFGGAFTDATCINVMSLNADVRTKLMRSYFSEEGIEYNIGRIVMAASDFSTHPYSYHDEEDIALTNYSLAHEDYNLKFPLLHSALNLTNNNIIFFASTWIAPKWMKENGNYSAGLIKKNMYQVYANYFVKFLDAYKKEGITFWGITTGNEPSSGFTSNWPVPTVTWSSSLQKKWIRDNLGPTIANSSHSDIKIIMLDDQRSVMSKFMEDILSDEKASGYIKGVGLHWYQDSAVPASKISVMQKKFPNKFFLATEASQGSFAPQAVQLGNWERAEEYAASVIEDLNNWVTGWMDWNMVLNLQGGPTYISNYCDAPIIVNATAQEFIKQPMYYALGHFSKFVPRHSQRISACDFSSYVPVIAFKRPDGGLVVVILNRNDTSVDAVLEDKHRGNVSLHLTGNSITTIVYW